MIKYKETLPFVHYLLISLLETSCAEKKIVIPKSRSRINLVKLVDVRVHSIVKLTLNLFAKSLFCSYTGKFPTTKANQKRKIFNAILTANRFFINN